MSANTVQVVATAWTPDVSPVVIKIHASKSRVRDHVIVGFVLQNGSTITPDHEWFAICMRTWRAFLLTVTSPQHKDLYLRIRDKHTPL